MSKNWVVCKYPELALGSSVKGVKVPRQKCLSCCVSLCPNKRNVLIDILPKDVTEIPARGGRVGVIVAKVNSDFCPLTPHLCRRCSALRMYCPYNGICALAAKYPKLTIVIKVQEVPTMYFVKHKKKDAPLVKYSNLIKVSEKEDIKQIAVVLEVTEALVARLEFVPKKADGSMPAVKTPRGVEGLSVIGEDGSDRTYDDLLSGAVKSLFIIKKEYVPALSLVKVPIDPQPRSAAQQPATGGRKKK